MFHRIAICPKCETFTLMPPSAGPEYFCAHYEGTLALVCTQNIDYDKKVNVYAVHCKVITIKENN